MVECDHGMIEEGVRFPPGPPLRPIPYGIGLRVKPPLPFLLTIVYNGPGSTPVAGKSAKGGFRPAKRDSTFSLVENSPGEKRNWGIHSPFAITGDKPKRR